MAIFRICIAQQIPLEVDLPEKNLADLARTMATRNHMLIGTMDHPDENGVCRKVMIPASRIVCVFELD
ncbi:hypothetical protein GRI44_02415 [Altererythrobacter confluentis]|uniref:Uncharacterized protein n=1 Tax=Allopontixanthobacter confluentis TaxID=1849021 RepID=A0A6L7GCH4_9SPHN|nr:hypothetical protein [Allopontixanthobacter confluentis]MXP13607.1 hypothetical protein [Allopontixanthobacter confluentis]